MELLRATQQQAHYPSSPCLALAATRAWTHPMLDLQKRIGNRAVLRLLKPKALQATLAMNQPGEVYEQEADGVADLVKSEAGSPVQRKCACGGAGPAQDALERMVSHRVEAHIGAGTPVTRIDFLAASPCAAIARNGPEKTRIVTLQLQTGRLAVHDRLVARQAQILFLPIAGIVGERTANTRPTSSGCPAPGPCRCDIACQSRTPAASGGAATALRRPWRTATAETYRGRSPSHVGQCYPVQALHSITHGDYFDKWFTREHEARFSPDPCGGAGHRSAPGTWHERRRPLRVARG